MSFGDIAPTLPTATPVLPPPAISELQRLLKPLAANNAALRQTSALLRSDDRAARPDLKRVRALREQNRQIARAAAAIVSSVDLQTAGRQPDIVQKANGARREFQQLLDDFSAALTESVAAERDYLRTAANGELSARVVTPSDAFSESQAAVEQDRISAAAPSENDPLLPRRAGQTLREQAVLREIEANDSLMQERNVVLSDVQSSIDDVNSIFKDLAVMITDQRTQVEHVEIAVSETAHNVSGARRELAITQKRREARKRFFFVTLISIAAIIAVFLIFLLN